MLGLLLSVNSAGNFFFYSMYSPTFRTGIRRVFRCIFSSSDPRQSRAPSQAPSNHDLQAKVRRRPTVSINVSRCDDDHVTEEDSRAETTSPPPPPTTTTTSPSSSAVEDGNTDVPGTSIIGQTRTTTTKSATSMTTSAKIEATTKTTSSTTTTTSAKIEEKSGNSTMHYGTKPGHFETSIIHFPTSEGVSEVSAAEGASKVSSPKQANE